MFKHILYSHERLHLKAQFLDGKRPWANYGPENKDKNKSE